MPENKFDINKLKELAQDPLGIGIIVLSGIALLSLSLTSIALIFKGSAETANTTPNTIETNTEPIPSEPTIPGKIGNKVWIDTNRDGIQDEGEAGSAETLVYLIDMTSNTIQTNTTTSQLGEYIFENINPGNYEVQIAIPETFITSPFQAGGNRETDNDFIYEQQSAFGLGRVAKSNSFVLKSGEEQMGIDAGLQVFEEIKGSVWQDVNNDNKYDANDRGIQGIVVSLLDQDGNIIDSRISESDGIFKFTSIKPGKYSLKYESNQNYSTQDPTQQNTTLQQLTTAPAYTEPLEIKSEQKISGITQMFYEITPEIKSQLQVAVTPPPQPSAVATIAANPTVVATITPNPTAAQLTPTGTVTLPPTTTLTPTPIPSPTLTPIIT
ncbi:hypothetical protein KBD45_05860, partial [Candidatus Dojkabacteria bacterium]|nr:hypothetical protein [Candidatus Dojkabacteria bacterium]